jgi:hypothetical protein
VVLTMFDERTNLAQQVTAELKRYFGAKLCETTIPRNIRLAEAPSHGKPALMYDPRSKGAESYIRLAKEIIERQIAGAESLDVQTVDIGNQPSVGAQPNITTEGTEAHGENAGQEQDAAGDELDKSA